MKDLIVEHFRERECKGCAKQLDANVDILKEEPGMVICRVECNCGHPLGVCMIGFSGPGYERAKPEANTDLDENIAHLERCLKLRASSKKPLKRAPKCKRAGSG